jgi:catechol 2,3-dioxygenase-like lactoylglutathione lyase family enzyme
MQQTLTEMRNQIAGLGWYIRRTADSVALAEWYGGVLGLPLIRGRDPVWFFWGGDSLCFELKSDQAPDVARFSEPATAPMVPIFVSTDLTQTVARLAANGSRPVGELGEDVYFLDSDEQLVAIRPAPDPGSLGALPHEVGACPLPVDLLGWRGTICRVPDVQKEADFWREVCGLPVAPLPDGGGYHVDLGGDIAEGAFLEIRGGGMSMPIPDTRERRTDAVILRVDNHDLVNTLLKDAAIPLVNDSIRFNSASLTYCMTPSGRLVGFEERFEPVRYKVPRREFLEDRLAIERRAAAGATTA